MKTIAVCLINTGVCLFGLLTVLAAPVATLANDTVTLDGGAVTRYVLSCRKENGAFGPADQQYTDAAWNYPAVATLRLLGESLPQSQQVLQHGLGYPQGHVGYGHWQFYHQHRLRMLLGQPAKSARAQVQIDYQGEAIRYYGSPFGTEGNDFFHAGSNGETDARDLSAESLGYYNLSSLYYLLAGLKASGRTAANPAELVSFVLRRQAPSGGFVDLRTTAAKPIDTETHIASTFHAVASLKLLGAEIPRPDACAKFIAACQRPTGGFGFHPSHADLANREDIYYTWAALLTLRLLERAFPRPLLTNAWILSLQNADGGFGDQPRWRSRLYSTYYAVEALQALMGSAPVSLEVRKATTTTPVAIPEGKYGIYQALFKMPVVKPADLEGLQQRGLNLLALKSDRIEDAAPLLAEIEARQLKMDVVLCPEAYPHRLRWNGEAVLNHVGNFTLDARWNEVERTAWQQADNAGRESLTWPLYAERVLAPLRRQHSVCYPEQDFEMEFAYQAYDEGLHGAASYNALLAGFNWAPRDFVRVFPWRERYTTRLAPIADCDAHGDLAKWSPQLDYVRNVYLATGPKYADFLDATRHGRVACVVAKPAGVAEGYSIYGPEPVVAYLRAHVREWQWWPE